MLLAHSQVSVRNKYELKMMRQSGKITAYALEKTLDSIRPGISGLELEDIATESIKKLGGEPAFKTVKGYRWTTCITVNEQVVHGIPTDRIIKVGDLVSIDIGAIYKGWYTDAAWSILAGNEGKIKSGQDKKRFLKIGEKALWEGIGQAVDGNKIGDVSEAIQSTVEGAGYSVVRSLVGHGVGRQLHEEPEVPGFGQGGTGMTLKKGMTLAIEVIYNHGGYEVVLEDDNWTISSADGSWAGLFEMTVIVDKDKAEVLTFWEDKSHSEVD